MRLFILGTFGALFWGLIIFLLSTQPSPAQAEFSTAETDVFICKKLEHIVEIVELMQAHKKDRYHARFQQLTKLDSKRPGECSYEPPGKVGTYKVLARYRNVPFSPQLWIDMVIVQETTRKKPTRYLLLERKVTEREFPT